MNESDVVVLGSGAAGLTAALTAAVAGAKVTVLESTGVFGGTTAISGGGMWLPGNTLDSDHKEDLAGAKRYLERLTIGLIPEAVLDRYLAVAGTVPDFFAANTPLTFTADVGRPDYHAPWEGSSLTSRTVFASPYPLTRLGELEPKVRRAGPGGILPIQHSEEREHAGDPEAINRIIQERITKKIAMRGGALVGGLMEGCLSRGVTFLSNTRGRRLVVENGRVVGVVAERGGDATEFRARLGVVLASGGFEWNRELWDAFMGVPWDGPATPPCNFGDGIVMAAEAGAKLANLDKATWCPTRYVGDSYDGHQYVKSGMYGQYPGEILVNRKGRRFTNEGLNYNDIGRVFTRFDPHTYEFENYPCFAIGDGRNRARVAALEPKNGPGARGDGWAEANTLRGLAEQLGIDPVGLERQVKEWNENAVRGVDPVFGRGEGPWEQHIQGLDSSNVGAGHNPIVSPIAEPPFVGHRVRAGVFGTRGGPVTDENAQVVGWDNTPIPGLFGAGNTVAHPFAAAYPGGGGTLGPAVTFGHVAGRSVVGART